MHYDHARFASPEEVATRTFYGPLRPMQLERWDYPEHGRALYAHPTESDRYIRKDAELPVAETTEYLSQISEYHAMLHSLNEAGVQHVNPRYSIEQSDKTITIYSEVDRIYGVSLEGFHDYESLSDHIIQETDIALLGMLRYLRAVAHQGGMASAETLTIRQFMFDFDKESLVLVDVDPIFGWAEHSAPLKSYPSGGHFGSFVNALETVTDDIVKLQTLTEAPLQSVQRAHELTEDALAITSHPYIAGANAKLRKASR